MIAVDRRAFVGMSAGGLSALCLPQPVLAAAQGVTGSLPSFLPTVLSVDCASRHNFRTFRQNSKLMALTGVVSMSFVRGRQGSYQAGNLFLFPWLKPKGKGATLPAVMPVNAVQYVDATLIPDATLPPDEYFCRCVLQAPFTSFIGFQVDEAYAAPDAKWDWLSNTDKLADGKAVGIDWTSCNLNQPWFDGSHWIPGTSTCGGAAWRKLIVAGLHQAATATC